MGGDPDSLGGKIFTGGDFLKIDPFIDYTPKFKPPKKPKLLTSEQQAKAAELAADKKKKQAIGAYGTSDTVLTGPKGLGGGGGSNPQLGG